MPVALELISQHRCFGGTQRYYRHESAAIGLPMRFSVYIPPQAEHGPVPVLFYLAGLTCTEETFMIKAGAQRLAAELGVMLVAPDTSPRGANAPGEDESWDLGTGAGFYVDATTPAWRGHYRMYSYVTDELHGIVTGEALPGDASRTGILGTPWAATVPWCWRCAIRASSARCLRSRPLRRPASAHGARKRLAPTWATTSRHGPRTTPLA